MPPRRRPKKIIQTRPAAGLRKALSKRTKSDLVSGMSLDEFGQKMGYQQGRARRSAWQFLKRTTDPRLTMIEKAAKALGANMAQLMQDDQRTPH